MSSSRIFVSVLLIGALFATVTIYTSEPDIPTPVHQDPPEGISEAEPDEMGEGGAGESTSQPSLSDKQYKRATTTYFWVGEEADPENGFIANLASSWDEEWLVHFGGIDDPDRRCGYKPCGFEPLENSFYFALPYKDMDENGERKPSARKIPWYSEAEEGESLVKNRWIEIIYRGKTCYAQWEDVGPHGEDDAEYVFGANTLPKNTFDLRSGLDVSPAVRDCLMLPGAGETLWRLVEEREVPEGPWRETITTRI